MIYFNIRSLKRNLIEKKEVTTCDDKFIPILNIDVYKYLRYKVIKKN